MLSKARTDLGGMSTKERKYKLVDAIQWLCP